MSLTEKWDVLNRAKCILVDLMFVIFTKAFDTVSHNLLLISQ